MNAQIASGRKPWPLRVNPTQYLYALGQPVRIKTGWYPERVYKIIRQLPAEREILQYRIRSDNETHERVETQESLEPIVVNSNDLIKIAFKHTK